MVTVAQEAEQVVHWLTGWRFLLHSTLSLCPWARHFIHWAFGCLLGPWWPFATSVDTRRFCPSVWMNNSFKENLFINPSIILPQAASNTCSLLFIIILCLVFPAVHPDLHGDPVQAHHLQRLRLPRLVPGHRLLHGSVLGGLHTHLRPLQDLPVPWSHLQRGETSQSLYAQLAAGREGPLIARVKKDHSNMGRVEGVGSQLVWMCTTVDWHY